MSKNLKKTIQKAVILDVMALCNLSELPTVLNGIHNTSEYYVTNSCKKRLKPAYSWEGRSGDVTQTRLYMDADVAILVRIVAC